MELRDDAACALAGRRVRKQRQPRQARRDELGVVLRVTLPGANLLELVNAASDMGFDHRALEALDGRQAGRIDGTQAAGKRPQLAQLVLDGAPRQILQEVVLGVDTIERGGRRRDLVQEGQVVIDEMYQWLRGIHASHRWPSNCICICAKSTTPPPATPSWLFRPVGQTPMVQYAGRARHPLHRRDPDRQPRGHHPASSAGAPPGRRDRGRGHTANAPPPRAPRHPHAYPEPARAQRARQDAAAPRPSGRRGEHRGRL